MLKIFIAFVIFAAIALTIVFKMGDKIDMQGEGGSQNATEAQAPAAAPAAAAPVAASATEAAPAADAAKK